MALSARRVLLAVQPLALVLRRRVRLPGLLLEHWRPVPLGLLWLQRLASSRGNSS